MKLGLDDFLPILPMARGYGHYIAGLCPFHDDSKPSLFVYADGWFRCVACDRHGTHQELYNALQHKGSARFIQSEGVRFHRLKLPPASESTRISDFAHLAHDLLIEFPSRGWYLEERGVKDQIEPCLLGWFEGWYTIPVRDELGDVKGLILRAGPHIEKVSGERYDQPAGQRHMLYCPDWHLFTGASAVAVTFGTLDAITLTGLRFPAVTSTGGKSSFNPQWLENTRKRIFVIPDEGEEQVAEELVNSLGWRGKLLLLQYHSGMKDPNDYIRSGRKDELVAQIGSALGG